MYNSKLIFFGAVSACVIATCMASFPLTLTLGTTAYVLTASQVSIAAASVAALAIAKEAVLLSGLANGGRGRRDLDNRVVESPLHFEMMLDAIAQTDVADCGKLLICHSMAKNEHALTAEEKLITKLFDDLEVINPNTGYAEFQMAAYVGTFKQPEICTARYQRCPVPAKELGDLIKVQL